MNTREIDGSRQLISCYCALTMNKEIVRKKDGRMLYLYSFENGLALPGPAPETGVSEPAADAAAQASVRKTPKP